MRLFCQCREPTEQQSVMTVGVAVVGQFVSSFDHRRRRRVHRIIRHNHAGHRRYCFDLLHRVEVSTFIELNIGNHERFKAGANATAGFAHAFGHRSDFAPGLPQHRDDAVSLAQFMRSKHDDVVTIGGHFSIVTGATTDNVTTRENRDMNSLFAIPAWLDLVAVGIGAAQGAMFSSRYRGAELDLLGVAIIGIVSGFGGSMVRDILLSTDIAALNSNWYLVTAVLCALGGMLVSSLLHRIEMVINVLDALTIGIFGAIGTTKALAFGLPVVPALFIGVAAAVGGSILRDMLLALPMQLMQVGSLYAVAAGLGGVTVIVLLSIGQSVTVAGFAGVAVTTAIRMLSVILGWKLPAQRGVPTVTSVIRTIRNKPKRK